MKKSLKRALALLLACTIVIGSVYNTRQKAYASASTIIAGGGAAAVGVEVAFPYLLAITGVVAAGAAVYENRDKIKEWGSAQFGKFKKWVNDNLGELGWYADAAAAGVAIAKWGDKLGNGTLDKSDPTWSAYKKWLEKDVCNDSGTDAENEYIGKDATLTTVDGGWTGVTCVSTVSIENPIEEQAFFSFSCDKNYYAYGIVAKNKDAVMVRSRSQNDGAAQIEKYAVKRLYDNGHFNGWYFAYKSYEPGLADSRTFPNYIADYDSAKLTSSNTQLEAATIAANSMVAILENGESGGEGTREYTYVGGLAPSLGGAGVLEGDWDVVGVGEAEDEKETKLPWVGSPDLDHTISDVVSGEKTWTDVLDQVGVGVIDRTEEGSKVIDEDGVTTKDWVYADSSTKVPDITIPNEGEVSKELSNYTFAGLEKIFPFCLPFDMIDFIKVLDATPQAPHFKYAFPYPTTSGMKTYEIDIDLSPFDSVAELLRDMECLLFIMGLILVTRSRMIRG